MGMITATTGSILVEMKKNSTSLVFSTGRMLTAYAAGIANRITRIVETTVAMTEFHRYPPAPASNTALYWSSVGVKKNLGGLAAASASCLNEVSTIHRTGMKNPRASSHVNRVSAADPAPPPVRLRRASG